jgi:Cu/Ag efflux protein CusF
MKKLALLCTFLLSAVVTFAQQPAPPAGTEGGLAQQPTLGTEKTAAKQITGQVVSIDATSKTITLKKDGNMDPAASTTLPVDTAAVSTLKTLIPGEKVKLMCKTDDSGKEIVQSIEKDKPKQ